MPAAHPLLVPPALTAQVPIEAPAQVALVVAAAHPLLAPAILTAQVPLSAELQLAWEKVPAWDQALAQSGPLPPEQYSLRTVSVLPAPPAAVGAAPGPEPAVEVTVAVYSQAFATCGVNSQAFAVSAVNSQSPKAAGVNTQALATSVTPLFAPYV